MTQFLKECSACRGSGLMYGLGPGECIACAGTGMEPTTEGEEVVALIAWWLRARAATAIGR